MSTPSTVIDLSDIGKSLIAIEAEIKNCKASMEYHANSIKEYSDKICKLQNTAAFLMHDFAEGLYK